MVRFPVFVVGNLNKFPNPASKILRHHRMTSQVKNAASPYSPGLWLRIVEVMGTEKTGEIAESLELRPSSVSDWKHGRTTPSLDKLGEIASYGDTTIEYLMYGDAGKRHQPGDTTYFERWFLPADYREKLATIAAENNEEIKSCAQRLLMEAIDRRSNGLETLIGLTVRELVRQEMLKSEQPRTEPEPQDLGTVDEFLADSIRRHDDPGIVMREWYEREGWPIEQLSVPSFGTGWDNLTIEEKISELKSHRNQLVRHIKRHEVHTPKTPGPAS
jgi:transcriptional regulator with XRE-family HTH domain